MEALLIIPILLPFFRFGLPIHLQQALSFKKKVQAKDNLFWFQLVIFLSIQPLYFVNLTAYLILSLTVISALLFNLGCFYIREGKRPGFIIQNGLVNGSLLIAVCLFILKPDNTNIFHFIMIEIFVLLFEENSKPSLLERLFGESPKITEEKKQAANNKLQILKKQSPM